MLALCAVEFFPKHCVVKCVNINCTIGCAKQFSPKKKCLKSVYTYSFDCRLGTSGKIIHSQHVQHYLWRFEVVWCVVCVCVFKRKSAANKFWHTNRFTLCGAVSRLTSAKGTRQSYTYSHL